MKLNKKQLEIAKNISADFDYTLKELEEWEWKCIDEDPVLWNDIFFDGTYVLFAESKIIWY